MFAFHNLVCAEVSVKANGAGLIFTTLLKGY